MGKKILPSVLSCTVEEHNDQMDADAAGPVSANCIGLIFLSFFWVVRGIPLIAFT